MSSPTHPVPPVQLAWEKLPHSQRQELTRLLAQLLYRRLTAVHHPPTKTKEASNEQPSPHQ